MNALSDSFVADLFHEPDLHKLAQISALACGSPAFDEDATDFALPARLFVFVAALGWLPQALRSGSVAWFESTPVARQRLLQERLALDAMPGLADRYATSMARWSDAAAMQDVDRWLDEHEREIDHWLARLALAARADFVAALRVGASDGTPAGARQS